ncbi:MAG TPA: NAD/NADP octopine/nopaline dehydrogenase family protein [Gaiellaceae bacterium]|jgi:hypothetical protein
MMTTSGKHVLAICGGGNAGHALAVVASATFDGDIVWLVRSEERANLYRAATGEGLRSSGVITGHADRLRTVSSDPQQVIPDADIVVIAVPAFAHRPVLLQIAPYLKDDVLVGCAPARGGFEFEASSLIGGLAPAGNRVLFGLQTLPWSTRIVEAGRLVNFGAEKASVLMATLPAAAAPATAERLTQLFGMAIAPTSSFLDMTLGNPGQHIHPGLMYGHFHAWAGETFAEDAVPMFYADADEEVSASVEALSAETLTVAHAVEAASGGGLDLSGVLSTLDWLRRSYPTQTGDLSTVSSCFRTGPLLHRKAPMKPASDGRLQPQFDYRYLTEDVPFGLVVTRAIAELAGVATPAIDQVIAWTGRVTGARYLADGRIGGPDVLPLPIPQNYGVTTLNELLTWYAGGPDARRPSPVGS